MIITQNWVILWDHKVTSIKHSPNNYISASFDDSLVMVVVVVVVIFVAVVVAVMVVTVVVVSSSGSRAFGGCHQRWCVVIIDICPRGDASSAGGDVGDDIIVADTWMSVLYIRCVTQCQRLILSCFSNQLNHKICLNFSIAAYSSPSETTTLHCSWIE